MHYDYIIIGSGAGGSAAAYRLAGAGKQVLLLEKGKPLPKDGSTLDYQTVINDGLFKSKETWLNKQGKTFVPEEYFNLGGKTKWYGAALLRFDPTEFLADPAYDCLAWPFGYTALEPYYAEAERLLGVRTFTQEPDLVALDAKLKAQSLGWKSQPLPLALNEDILNDEHELTHFDGFASVKNLKSDAEVTFLNKAMATQNLTVMTGQAVSHLLGNPEDLTKIVGVMLEDGSFHAAKVIILAAGAMHSPRLLQDYLNRSGLANTLPSSALVGTYFKRHLLTAMLAFSPTKKQDKLRKTVIWYNNNYSHGSVQPLGFSNDVLAALFPACVPRWLANKLSQYAYGFFLQTEDGSHPGNRVNQAQSNSTQILPKLDYDEKRIAACHKEHRHMVRNFSKALRKAGFISFTKSIGLEGTAHACGTLVAGNDPAHSVVDGNGKVHGMANLYVADGSILPRSSRVNPALTIYAWSLRLATKLITTNEVTT